MKRPLLTALAAVLALALAAGGYWAYGASQKRTQQRKVAALVRDTTEQLRQALEPRAPAAVVARIDANLQEAKAPRDPALAEAAEEYIIGAREIARRRIDAERLARQAAVSRQALAGHMARAARRNDAWIRDALELKRRVERDHFELGITLKALDELLYTLPDAEKRLAPRVGPALLLDQSVREQARKQVQADAKRSADELEKTRHLAVR